MKKLTTIATLIIISAITAFAQNGDEKSVRQFVADYDQAYLNQNIGFMEANFAAEYTFSDSTGSFKNRDQSIEEAKKEKAAPTEKTLSFKSETDSVRVVGSTAIASGSWMWSGVPLSNLQGEPHNDKGRFTLVFEKRKGKWMLVAEQFSEAPHDKKLMEAQVLKMGKEYGEMIKRGDAAELEKILADEYQYTDSKGKVLNKAEDLATYKSGTKFDFAETTDQKVRIIGNNAAVETGTFRFRGTDKDGKPFEGVERYTTTWVWRGLRWQIAADHTSTIEK